jgi:hypothetical protein
MAERLVSLPGDTEIDHAVPAFLDQLCQELRGGPPQAGEIRQSARDQGQGLFMQGFTIAHVVNGYGDICQSVTDLAMELAAPISTDDFRTLNRCLDDAIASAVSAYSQERDVSRVVASQHLQQLADSAITAFEVLRTGRVGVGGSTGAVILQSLKAIRGTLVDQQLAEQADKLLADNALVPAARA